MKVIKLVVSLAPCVAIFATAQVAAQQSTRPAASDKLEEVLVTAQKTSENLKDVPVPVAVLNSAALVERNAVRLQDYYSTVPGLSLTKGVQSSQILAIRGVTTGGLQNPTVAVLVDDVPFAGSGPYSIAQVVPDIDPGDLARVETLRGPQGTLYGASSLGGLLKYVTVDASTEGMSGQVEVGSNYIENGDDVGYSVRGAINLPLSDTMAVRVSAFTRDDPGYIDDPSIGAKGVNEEKTHGGRLIGNWHPSDAVSLKITAAFQETKPEGASIVDEALGDLVQNQLRDTGWAKRELQSYSGILKVDFGSMQLDSVTGFTKNEMHDSLNYSPVDGLTQLVWGEGGTNLLGHGKTEKFTQELRLSGPIGEQLKFLVGAFYADEDSHFQNEFFAAHPATGDLIGSSYLIKQPTTLKELAGFLNLTYQVTDRFDVQVGGRASRLKQTQAQNSTGFFTPLFGLGQPPYIVPKQDTKSSPVTYLLTPRFKVTPDLIVYARLASGFRNGGVNANPEGLAPPEFDPDKTQNYEVGLKGDFLDNRLTLDASLYYIDWKDLQLQLLDPNTQTLYTANGSAAKSQGIELSASSAPTSGLTISAWVSWNDAELTKDLPPESTAIGNKGDRLPWSSRTSGSLSIRQEFTVTTDMTAFVGGTAAYVGKRKDVFGDANATRAEFPSYSKFDVLAGAEFNESWKVSLYCNNVADKRGELGNLAYLPEGRFLIRPREFGLSVAKTF